jgi:hypothetical protein
MPLKDRVVVDAGAPMECVQLQVTLAGSGITVEVEHGLTGAHELGADSLVFVTRSDVQRAAVIVEDFKLSCQKNQRQPVR